MKIALVSFTKTGGSLCRRLLDSLIDNGHVCDGYAVKKYAEEVDLHPIEQGLSAWTGAMFRSREALVFIGACGIAVRAAAPFLKHKTKDPAVVVVDEAGKFAISLLSGHIGGANELTTEIAEILKSTPVITTATDIQGLFAVDRFAVRNNLYLSNINTAKYISAAVLDGKQIAFYSDFAIQPNIPRELSYCTDYDYMMGLTSKENPCIHLTINGALDEKEGRLILYPRILVLGIGCKQNTSYEDIRTFIIKQLKQHQLSLHSIHSIASIDIKANEEGILRAAEEFNVQFHTYSASALMKMEGDFHSSEFVRQVTGADNVCERAAAAASKGGSIIVPRTTENGITLAIAMKEWEVSFE